jgi:hypothetical protein
MFVSKVIAAMAMLAMNSLLHFLSVSNKECFVTLTLGDRTRIQQPLSLGHILQTGDIVIKTIFRRLCGKFLNKFGRLFLASLFYQVVHF